MTVGVGNAQGDALDWISVNKLGKVVCPAVCSNDRIIPPTQRVIAIKSGDVIACDRSTELKEQKSN